MANPPEGMPAAFAAQFLKIQQAFVAGLPRRLADILEAPDAQSRHVALHQLAGAAGGYGYAALSDLAREAMQAQESDAELLQNVLQRLAQAVSEVRLTH